MEYFHSHKFVFLLLFCLGLINCIRLKLSCEQIRNFVDGHNARRTKVAQGAVAGQPPASDISYMVWDEELAEKAAEWAEHGLFAHNPDRSIGSRRWNLVGENIYQSWYYSPTGDEIVIPNIEDALDNWFNEHKNYKFTPFSLELHAIKPIAHYTQLVWGRSNRVGCGISQRTERSNTTTLFVCNYGPTGNFFGQVPYTASQHKGFLRCVTGGCDRPYGARC